MSIITFALVMMVSFNTNAQSLKVKVGEQHNIDLEEILKQLSGPIENSKTVNIEDKRLEVVKIAKSKYGKEFYPLIDQLSTFNDPYELLNSFKDRMSNELYNQVYSDLEQIKRLNSEFEINNYISIRKSMKTMGEPLAANEASYYNNFLSVLEYSNSFWYSKKGENILAKKGVSLENSKVAKNDIKWWKVLACDAVGAVGGAIVAGASTSGLGTGAGAVVGAVVASGCSAINQY